MPPPFASVIVPTFNRPEALRTCLEAILQQRYPAGRVEVLVVDDGGDAPLDALVSSLREQARQQTLSGVPIRLVRQPNAGPAAARNYGAHLARGALLAFTDDDCRPAPMWLAALADAHAACPTALLGGHTRNALPDNLFSSASQLLVDFLRAYHRLAPSGSPLEAPPTAFFTSNNIAAPRTLFHEVGGFDTAFPLAAGEDREFGERWTRSGYALRYVPTAHVDHAHPLSLTGYLRQHFNYGRGALRVHRHRAHPARDGVLPEPPAFYADLLRYPARCRHPDALRLTVLFGLAQAATAAGLVREALLS